MPVKNKYWKITNLAKNKAQLLLYGDIMAENYWWDDNVITPDSLISQLDGIKDVSELEIRINSGGGDVFAASAIYNLLKDFNAKKTVIIDGLVASAATIIAMAGDVVKMPVSSLFMIHNPFTYVGGEANELAKAADLLQKVKDVIIDTYRLKTHLSKEEISKMMDETTWMNAEDAKEFGFIDEISSDLEETPYFENNGQVVVFNSVQHDISKLKDAQQKISAKLKNSVLQTKPNNQTTGGKKNMGPEEIKNQYPDAYKAIQDAAAKAERSRIQAIEDVAMPGMEKIINAAKYENGATAEQVAMSILKAQKEQQKNQLSNVIEDAAQLNVEANEVTNSNKNEDFENTLTKVITNLGGVK